MPYKISIWIALFLLFFNGGAVFLSGTGAAGYLGVSAGGCAPASLEQATDEVRNFGIGGAGGQTLFGLYNRLADPFETMFNLVMPGAAMLKCNGLPVTVVNFLLAGLSAVPGIDLILFLRRG